MVISGPQLSRRSNTEAAMLDKAWRWLVDGSVVIAIAMLIFFSVMFVTMSLEWVLEVLF